MTKRYFRVSYQYSERTYCTNIAHAPSIEDVENHYKNYAWFNIEEATETDLAEAERKGMPIVEIEAFAEIKESKADELQAWYNKELQYIENGTETDADAGLRKWSTDYMWSLYTSGERTAEVVEYRAVQRLGKAYAKKVSEAMENIEQIEKEEAPCVISVSVEWKRSPVWGLNPSVIVTDGHRRTFGRASGCGYDKQSAAVADAFNSNPSIKRILFDLKEKALADGQTDRSETACTGRDNRGCVGYGSGYDALPYYEGGVGVECFWAIFRKAGYTITSSHTKRSDFYTITK